MIKVDKIEAFNIDGAMRAMRNPMNSWAKNDTVNGIIGPNDLDLAQRLVRAGTEHAKFMRQIGVSMDIEAPLFWWKEFDTYKVGTTRNSCSTMHKIHVKPFVYEDFSHEGIDGCSNDVELYFRVYIGVVEDLRLAFNQTNDKNYWRALIEMLPSGYNMKSTITMNYQNARNMYFQRKNHKLNEWVEFCDVLENLPYGKELICLEKE